MTWSSSDKSANRRTGLKIIGGLALALACAATAQAAVPITTCGYTISTPGTYVLDAGFPSGCPGNGIIITASNVTLMLGGHAILPTPENPGATGIVVQGPGRIRDIHIQGSGLIQQFQIGIQLVNVDNSQIQQVVSAFNSVSGIATSNCTNLQFSGNVLAANDQGGSAGLDGGGLVVGNDNGDKIQQNEVTGNGTMGVGSGIVVSGGSGNQVHDNNVDGNNFDGILIASSSSNSVFKNYPYPAKTGCPTVAGNRRTRLAPPGMAPAVSWL
jgi:parallel beta-helix repeat protein